jgi:hypothetical protein
MQAPHPPEKKTAQKHKVWAKKTLKKKIGQPMDFLGPVSRFGEGGGAADRKIM